MSDSASVTSICAVSAVFSAASAAKAAPLTAAESPAVCAVPEELSLTLAAGDEDKAPAAAVSVGAAFAADTAAVVSETAESGTPSEKNAAAQTDIRAVPIRRLPIARLKEEFISNLTKSEAGSSQKRAAGGQGIFLLSVLRLNIDRANSGTENTDLGAVMSSLDNDSLVLDADDLTDNTADGSHLVADLKAVSHCISFLLLLFLRADHKEIENYDKDQQHYDRNPALAHTCAGSSSGCFVKKIIHFKVSLNHYYMHCIVHYTRGLVNAEDMQRMKINILYLHYTFAVGIFLSRAENHAPPLVDNKIALK